MYDRRLEGETLLFGNTSALYENDLVMFDYQTGSYWAQVGGDAIVGTLTGERLEPLPAITMSWRQWSELHPDTLVLSRNQGFNQPQLYTQDPFRGYERRVESLRFRFPLSRERIGAALGPAEIVISVKVGAEEKAYPLERIGGVIVNDTVGGQPVVVFSRANATVGGVFSRAGRGRTLTFRLDVEWIVDLETRTRWDLSGRAVEGDLAGEQLELLPGRRAFWFSISLGVPDVTVYEP